MITDNDFNYHDVLWYQHRHDAVYHRDIHHMQLMSKLSHLNHHLVKYFTRIRKFQVAHVINMKDIVDACVCCLSALSALGVRSDGKSLVEFVVQQRTLTEDEIIFEIGRISKVIEGFDHLESINYRAELNECFSNLLSSFITCYYRNGGICFINDHYIPRLTEIKQKNPFHEHFLEEERVPMTIETR